jgi:phosphatidylserine/phosphatidylglycerophosphate/cardiolipin synthase-like enzyme
MRVRSLVPVLLSGLVSLFAVGCAADEGEDLGESEANFTEGSAEARAILALVNAPSVTVAELTNEARITRAAATNIIGYRDGADARPGTADDNLFGDLRELDAVREVGPATLRKLYEYAQRKGLGGEASQVEVVFSPQPTASSHLAKIAGEIERATTSIDIAMYSYSDANITAKLAAAAQRGVKIRFIYEDAGGDNRAANRETTTSMKLENAGADVRYVNKIMHHKMMIVDGPRDDLSKAKTARLVTGSANWSNSAATRYDENTMFIGNAESLVLQFQREFDLLWEHTKDFTGKPYEHVFSSAEITDASIPESPNAGVFFTSKNFTPNGTTFSMTGTNNVADALVRAIAGATSSIHIASGHLRSRPVAEALIAKKQASPNLDVRVYLDNQEYLSKSAHEGQLEDLDACLDRATSDAQRRNCTDKGFLFGYQIGQAGIDVRYKYYAYRWDHSYAPQMHHKYMVIDKTTLWSGSYNLSDNAEHGTFENMVVLRGAENAATVAAFEANFESMWKTGKDDNKLATLLDRIENAPNIPLVFDAMALTWSEVTNLKQRIRTNCPAVDSAAFRSNAAGNMSCPR